METQVVDFGEHTDKAKLWDKLKQLRGRWRIWWCRYAPRRSDRKNRFYWPAVVEPFAEYLTETWGEPVSKQAAHEFLKARFNKIEVVDRNTGEVFERVGRTRDLTDAEFMAYVDRCRVFLAEYCHLAVRAP